MISRPGVLRTAFAMAQSMEFAMGAQKRNEAQMETLLDNSFNGVVRVDENGRIVDINPIMEGILQKEKADTIGHPIKEVFRDLDEESLRQILEEGNESYSLFMQINHKPVFAIIAPIVIDGKAEGAILTCHRMKKPQPLEEESQKQRHSRKFIALGQFDDIIQKSPAMQKCIRFAKLCAMSEKPILLVGEAGTEIRVMTTTKIPLENLVREGRLREDLYYLLNGLTVRIPPCRERPEDMEWKINTCIKECCEHYSRYHVLTQGAKKRLMEYPWKGNMFQVENFCERLILSASKRSLDENAVGELLSALYPDEVAEKADTPAYAGPVKESRLPEEALQILDTLKQMAGNREKTANALGISKTTLWRKIKKYGLEQKQ